MPAPASTRDPWAAAREVAGTHTLSVLMPAYNLAGTIAENVRRVHAVLRASGLPFEIVAVDDGSTDGTAGVLRSLAAELAGLRPVLLARNAGKGGALRRGFEAARGDFILFLDADLDLPPEQIPAFFEVMRRERADAVIGSKRHPDSALYYPWHRRLMSAGYSLLVRLLFGLPVRDTQTGLKLFRRAALEWAFPRLLVKAFAFDLELLSLAHLRGHRIAEAPVRIEFRGRWGCVRPGTLRGIVLDTLAVFYRLRLLRYYDSIPDTRMPEPAPAVSVVIACPGPSRYLDETLAALLRQTLAPLEILVLPDAPSGRAWPADVREIPTGRIRPAEKRNAGIRAARGTVTAFLDDDACPTEEWLARALPFFSLPDVAAVGGPAVTPASDPYLARIGGRVYESVAVSGPHRNRYLPVRVQAVDDFPSCNLLVRTDVLRRLGGFRTDFWPGEDTYLCMEIVRGGQRILYAPLAIVSHHRRPLFVPHLRQISRYARHRGYFARRFRSTSLRPGYLLPSLFVLGLAAGGALALALPALRPAYAAALALYAALTLAVTAHVRPDIWLFTWLGTVATHLTYGVFFLAGLLARRMPGEVRPFDHVSETPENAR